MGTEKMAFTVSIGSNKWNKLAFGICEGNAAAAITACVIDASHPANED